MPKFHFDKLVRDKLLETYAETGHKADYQQLKGNEHMLALVRKGTEELAELMTAPPEQRASELADVQEVVDSLKRLLDVSDEELREAQAFKTARNGSFDRGIYVRSLEVPETDGEWVEYYRREPRKYPEEN